jgi:propionyl-CoA carboxylase beta chain
VITRKAYGGAYDVMASKHVRADVNYAYPTAEIAVMGPEGAVSIVYRDQLAAAKDAQAAKAAYVAEYREKFANPYAAAELGYIDEVIRPRDTRAKIAGALRMLRNKRQSNPPKKHGNVPL